MRLLAALALAVSLAPPASTQTLRPFVKGSWNELRRAQAGRPFIVHFWGITCPPCLGELPEWRRLEQEHPKVPIVFVAADPVPVDRARIAAALEKAGLSRSGELWAFDGEFYDPLRFEVSPDWAGELPFTLLVDKTGAVTPLVGLVDMAAVRAWLRAHGGTDARGAGARR
jgi:thiol-disulfide isomerase/thioredoxin